MSKMYTLDDIAGLCAEKGETAATKQNISKFFFNYFESLRLEKEWVSLKRNGKYSFSETEAATLVSMYLERNNKLKRQQDGTYSNIDMDYIFSTFDGIYNLFCTAPSSSPDEIRNKLEKQLTNIITKNFSIEKHTNELLSYVNKIINLNIGEKHYLTANHKYYWMLALRKDLDHLIEYWINIFFMERIQMAEVYSEFRNQWFNGNLQQEITDNADRLLADDKLYQRFMRKKATSVDQTEKEFWDTTASEHKASIFRDVLNKTADSQPIPRPIDPKELLERAIAASDYLNTWLKKLPGI